MPDHATTPGATEFTQADLRGARFRRVRLNDARFRMVDLSGAVLRDVSLSGASIDGEIDGLVVNGVDIAPLVEAELTRRDPARALRRASDPDGLRAAWKAIEQGWARTDERLAALPAETAYLSVEDEWSLTDTLRHLVFATDAWLGAIRGEDRPFHPWGLPFSTLPEFVERLEDLPIDPDASPSYGEVLDVRADRATRVRDFLAEVTPERLAEECVGPVWEDGRRLSVLRCVWVILNEECEHRRFAERDLDLIEAGSVATVSTRRGDAG